MPTGGEHTLHEILSQPAAWAAILPVVRQEADSWRSFLAPGAAELTVFFGCGSTHYLSLTAAAVQQALSGHPARAVPSSELLFYPELWLPAGERVRGVAVSRSGTTTETLRAVRALAAGSGPREAARVAAVTCYERTPLAEHCTPILVSPEGHEQSVAQTRSFSSMLVGTLAVAALGSGQEPLLDALARIPAHAERLLGEQAGLAQSLGGDAGIARVFFLGSGPRYGLACEAMLKMKEMSLTASEAYHFLEFRHGPKSMVDAATLVVGLLSESAHEAEAAVLREMKALGARVLVLAESAAGLDWADHVVAFDSGQPELARLPLYLPVLHLLGYYRATGKGLDPDRPRHLDAVVEL